jgi:hypothetical protein
MTPEEIRSEIVLKRLFTEPESVFAEYERNGGDYEDLRRLQIGKVFAQVKFPEIADNDYIGAAEFMFWIAYYIERDLNDLIIEIEVALGRQSRESVEQTLNGLVMGRKIQYMIDRKHTTDSSPYVVFLKSFSQLRNHMAHGRLNKLEYKGYKLSHPKGQILLTSDLRNALIKKH